MQNDPTVGSKRNQDPERRLPDDSPGFALAERCAWHLLEKNLENVIVLDDQALAVAYFSPSLPRPWARPVILREKRSMIPQYGQTISAPPRSMV